MSLTRGVENAPAGRELFDKSWGVLLHFARLLAITRDRPELCRCRLLCWVDRQKWQT